jgi:hypothetical protein
MLMKADKQGAIMFDVHGIVESSDAQIVVRVPTLGGLRLGILDNSKWTANKILRGSASALTESIRFATVNYYVKHSFSKDAAPELIQQIAAENDIVLTAIGDRGSCSFCCIRDAIAFERLGVPSAAIITTEFVRETELTRVAVGMKDLVRVVIDHPVSSITRAEVEVRVAQVKTQTPAVWTARAATV